VGSNPYGEIPVEQPTKLQLLVNLTTAKALGLDANELSRLRLDVSAPKRQG
jgi:hypothetical protein